MERLPAESVDLVFADPPYNLQLRQDLWRPNHTRVDRVDDAWDQFTSFEAYDEFTQKWLLACKRVLKPTSTLWVIGTYHNIHRVGSLLQSLGYWILNDLVWIKSNPMPNFRGVRFTNAHETLIWAQKERGAPYTFNHHAMKALNEGLQMRSDWYLPLCTGKERLREEGVKVHATQKPEALLYRVVLASSQPGDLVLDPFFGTGTTGVACSKLGRKWIGIESNPAYIRAARERLGRLSASPPDLKALETPNPRREPRVPFGLLVECGLLHPGQELHYQAEKNAREKTQHSTARILADGRLWYDGTIGSIHEIARLVQPETGNGWQVWQYLDEQSGEKRSIDHLRAFLRGQIHSTEE
jgi:modification methylase